MDRKSFSFCQFVSLQQTSDKLKALIKNVWRLQWIKLNNKIMRSERRERRTEFEWKDRPSVSFQECRWIKQKSNKLSTVRISGNLCLFAVRFFLHETAETTGCPPLSSGKASKLHWHCRNLWVFITFGRRFIKACSKGVINGTLPSTGRHLFYFGPANRRNSIERKVFTAERLIQDEARL